MKKSILLCIMLISVFAVSVKAESDIYISKMKETINNLDSARTESDLIQVANDFERIANAEKDMWLPYYYAAYCNIIVNYYKEKNKEKDNVLDKAEKLLNLADSVNTDSANVELIILKGYLMQSRYTVNPAVRARKIAPVAEQLLTMANTLDPENPRYYFLKGQNLFYTPKPFGGGKDKAKPLLETALEKYNAFTPPSEIHPNWGKDRTEYLLSECG